MRHDKEIFFKTATLQLMNTIDSMNLADVVRVKDLVKRMREAFLNDDIRATVFGKDLADDMSVYVANGFCAAACISFINAIGNNDWELMYIDEMWTFGPHYFLRHKPSGKVLDLTFDHQDGILDIPYYLGCKTKPTKYSSDMAKKFSALIGVTQNKQLLNQKIR